MADDASISGRNHSNFFAFLNPDSLPWVLPGLSHESFPPVLRDWRHRQRPFRELRKFLRSSKKRARLQDRLNACITDKPKGNLVNAPSADSGDELQTLRRGLGHVLRHSLNPKVTFVPLYDVLNARSYF